MSHAGQLFSWFLGLQPWTKQTYLSLLWRKAKPRTGRGKGLDWGSGLECGLALTKQHKETLNTALPEAADWDCYVEWWKNSSSVEGAESDYQKHCNAAAEAAKRVLLWKMCTWGRWPLVRGFSITSSSLSAEIFTRDFLIAVCPGDHHMWERGILCRNAEKQL